MQELTVAWNRLLREYLPENMGFWVTMLRRFSTARLWRESRRLYNEPRQEEKTVEDVRSAQPWRVAKEAVFIATGMIFCLEADPDFPCDGRPPVR